MATNLKQFEKWRDEKHTGAGIYTTVALKAGWKAALEWVEDVASKNKDKKTLIEIIKELESGY